MARPLAADIFRELVASRFVYHPGDGIKPEIVTASEVAARKLPADKLAQHDFDAPMHSNRSGITALMAEGMQTADPHIFMWLSGKSPIPLTKLSDIERELKLTPEESFRLFEGVVAGRTYPPLSDALSPEAPLHLLQNNTFKDVIARVAAACCINDAGRVVPWHQAVQEAFDARDPALLSSYKILPQDQARKLHDRYVDGERGEKMLPLTPAQHVMLEALNSVPTNAKSVEQLADPDNAFLPDGKFRAKGDLLREWREAHAMVDEKALAWSTLVARAFSENNPGIIRKAKPISLEDFGKLLGSEHSLGGPEPVSHATVGYWENGENLSGVRKYHAMLARIYEHIPAEAITLLRTAPEHECFSKKTVAAPSRVAPQNYVSAEQVREQLRSTTPDGRTDL